MNKQMTKVKGTNKCIVTILALALVLAIILSIYAYSKYTSSYKGASTSTVAKWSFLVNGHSDEEIGDIDFVQTIENQNNVVEKKVAPGTQGKFELTLDGTGSEVAIDYKIALTITEKPRNLKIYEDSEYKNEVTEQNGEFDITGSIPLEEVNTPLVKPVYWKWAYETGTTEEEIKSNDKIDTEDSKKSVTMTIKVTGTQRNPASLEPGVERLADVANIGDYVNYDASSGNGAGKSYTTEASLTGTSNGISTFNSNETMKWKVMSIDKQTGTVKLMAENPTTSTVTLYGKTGYKNAVTVLDKVADVYGQGKGATGGKSITVEDVNKLENYTPTDDTTTSYTYTSGTFINDDGTETIASTANPVTKKYIASSTNKSTNKYYDYSTENFKNKTFWLASPCIGLYSSNCYLYVRYVNSGRVYVNYLFRSNGTGSGNDYSVIPVVSLKSNIQTRGKTEGEVWILENE